MTHSAAIGALTRLSMTLTTSSTRARLLTHASTRSPTRTLVAAFAAVPLTRTWPARHRSVATERVFARRTAQIQRSTRVSSTSGPAARDEHGDAALGLRLVLGIGRIRGHGALPPHRSLVTVDLSDVDIEGLRAILDHHRRGIGLEVEVPDRVLRCA